MNSRWKRLGKSFAASTLLVVVSTIAVLVLAGFDKQPSGNRLLETASDVLGFPLATGWLFVETVFGEWRAVHQGQIALVPFLSIVIDALMIFLVWEFIHRKRSGDLASTDVLHISG